MARHHLQALKRLIRVHTCSGDGSAPDKQLRLGLFAHPHGAGGAKSGKLLGLGLACSSRAGDREAVPSSSRAALGWRYAKLSTLT